MDTSDIIEQLAKLQLEQTLLISQLIKQNNKEVSSTKEGVKPPKRKSAGENESN